MRVACRASASTIAASAPVPAVSTTVAVKPTMRWRSSLSADSAGRTRNCGWRVSPSVAWWRCAPAPHVVQGRWRSSSPWRQPWVATSARCARSRVPNCPWLIVQGDADEVIDGELVVDWAEQLEPAPQLVVLPDVGHFFHGKLVGAAGFRGALPAGLSARRDPGAAKQKARKTLGFPGLELRPTRRKSSVRPSPSGSSAAGREPSCWPAWP